MSAETSISISMAMEHVVAIIPILVLLMAGPTNSVQAVSSSSLGKNCVTQLLGLYPCLDFVTNGKVDSVSPQCCSAIEATVKANVMCLCLLFTNNSEIVGVSINQTKALLLPTLCKIVVPPVSTCQSKFKLLFTCIFRVQNNTIAIILSEIKRVI